MTLINFVQKDKLPSKIELENKIKALGYDFKFLTDFEKFNDLNQIDSIDCLLNGNQTFIEIYFNKTIEVLSDFPNLKKKILNKELRISFTFNSDELVSDCINIISVGLMDLSESIVLYADDEIFYTREMLIQDIINPLKNNQEKIYTITKEAIEENLRYDEQKQKEKRGKIKNHILWGILFLAVVLMQREFKSWIINFVLLILILFKSQIDLRKKNKPKK